MTGSIEAYEHPIEHLTDELKRLDIILEQELLQMNVEPSEAEPFNEIPGLFISASEAKSLMTDTINSPTYTYEQEQRLAQISQLISDRLQLAAQLGRQLPIVDARRRLHLSEMEYRALIVALAPHVSRRYVKLYGHLQDDIGNGLLTVDLLLRLCCETPEERRQLLDRLIDPTSLFRSLLHGRGGSGSAYAHSASLLTQQVQLRGRLTHYLLGMNWRYDGPLGHCQLYTVESNRRLLQDSGEGRLHEQIAAHCRQTREDSGLILWLLRGPAGSGKTYQARLACASLDKALLEWDISHAPEEEQAFHEAVDGLLLEASLQDAIPAIDHLHTLQLPLTRTTGTDRRQEWLMGRLAAYHGHIFIFSEEEFKPIRPSPECILIDIPLPIPDIGERRRLWQTLAGESLRLNAGESDALAGKFLFTPGQIAASVEEARKLADWRLLLSEGDEEPMSASRLLHQAAYQLINHRLQDKAVKLEPKFEWTDLILPTETLQLLRQASNRVRDQHKVMHSWGFERKLPYGRGISMLFTGPPGTGKTMSAMVMAREMGAELYRIDLSRVVSKYIGETEKNLSDIFDQARQSGAILFFDEADALFGKRSEVKDSHDKYANMETAYLLQKMEEYDGLTILATNFAQNLDDAFTRRIQFIVKYPFPDAAQREQLWRGAFPRETPVDELDYTFLSRSFELSGGSIKNVVLTAAYLAAREGDSVGMKHLIEGIIQEYKKSGKVLLKDRMGPYADYWKG